MPIRKRLSSTGENTFSSWPGASHAPVRSGDGKSLKCTSSATTHLRIRNPAPLKNRFSGIRSWETWPISSPSAGASGLNRQTGRDSSLRRGLPPGLRHRRREISRSCLAVASRNVSTLVPDGVSSPDLAWIAAAIRCESASRVDSDISSRRAKNPSSTSRSAADSLATPMAGKIRAACGSGAGMVCAKASALNVRALVSPHSGASSWRSRTTSVPATRSPRRWCSR